MSDTIKVTVTWDEVREITTVIDVPAGSSHAVIAVLADQAVSAKYRPNVEAKPARTLWESVHWQCGDGRFGGRIR